MSIMLNMSHTKNRLVYISRSYFLTFFFSDKMQHIITDRQNKKELKETDREKERERQTESQTDKERERKTDRQRIC